MEILSRTYYNRETEVNAGPFRLGFSSDLSITNKWIKNIHIHAKLRIAMRDKLNIKVSSTYKEVTDSGKKMHQKHVGALKEKLPYWTKIFRRTKFSSDKNFVT